MLYYLFPSVAARSHLSQCLERCNISLKGWCSSSSREGASELLLSQQQQRPSFPRLTTLKITECPTLTSMPMVSHVENSHLLKVPEKLLHQLLTSATTTAITEGFASSSSSIPFISKLKDLYIWSIDELESLPEEVLQNLPSLEQLEIGWCDRLTSLSGVAQHITAPQHLTIYCCKNFDLSGGDGMHWQGLQRLRIGWCPLLSERCREETARIGLKFLTSLIL